MRKSATKAVLRRYALSGAVVLKLCLLFSISTSASAHEAEGITSARPAASSFPDNRARAEDINLALGNLLAGYQTATVAEKKGMAARLTALAEERRELLFDLLESNPAEVLRQALPDDLLDRMPEKAQAFLEQRLELEGDLQLLHVDYNDESQSHYVYLLTTDHGEQYSLHFARQEPDVISGARVRAKGLALYGIRTRDAGETDGAVAIEDQESDLVFLQAGGSKNKGSTGSSTTSTLPNTLGAQDTLLILVNFSDNATQPYTSSAARNLVFGTVSDFFMETSYQQTWLTGDVVGWFTIASNSTACDTGTIASEAKTAASKVVNLSAYAHLVYAFPQNNNCKWAGLSSVGGNPSQAWINGTLGARVVAHELSHGLGLWHSHSLNCGTTTLGTNCTSVEYGDVVDTMGGPIGFLYPAHFNAFQKERLGWLNAGISPEITTVVSDGTYILETYESPGSGPKALKILKSTDPSTGKRTWYYLESRQAIGFDAFLATNASIAASTNVTNGVLLHTGTESSGNSSLLLNLRPDTDTWWDPALAVGESFEDADAAITLTTDWVSESEAAVTVRFGSGTVTGSNVTISTDQASYTRGQTVSITAKVIAGDSPIANATVSFTVTKPNGSVVTGNVTTGSDGIAVYKLRLRKQDPVGIYQAGAVMTDPELSGNAATTFTVK